MPWAVGGAAVRVFCGGALGTTTEWCFVLGSLQRVPCYVWDLPPPLLCGVFIGCPRGFFVGDLPVRAAYDRNGAIVDAESMGEAPRSLNGV